jgi:ABC-type transport system involved in multi-copper enzyme maturation permease subunit
MLDPVKIFVLLVRLISGTLWLAGAYWCQNRAIGRYLFSFIAAIIIMVYAGALGGYLVAGGERTNDWGALLIGFIAGSAAGLLLGCAIGWAAARNVWVYWIIQIALAAVFAIMPPLY